MAHEVLVFLSQMTLKNILLGVRGVKAHLNVEMEHWQCRLSFISLKI